jgi:DNA-binding MarR family transcriptional regulator/catechol 2,3-dioxygenase-like lactoylglutathione lyase family enzyme
MPGKKDASDAALLRSAISALGRRLRANDDTSGIGPTALSVLARLRTIESATATELATLEHLQPQSLTRALKSLEEEGLIERDVDEADRRRAINTITPAGAALLRTALGGRLAWLRRAMDTNLTRAERDILRDAAVLMHRLAEDELSNEPIDGVFNLIPFAQVEDVARSIAFYERLGFEEDGREERRGTLVFASMHARAVRAARIMFARAPAPVEVTAQGIVFYCWTEDAKRLHASLSVDGHTPSAIAFPTHMPDGEFQVHDPDGYLVVIGQVRRLR